MIVFPADVPVEIQVRTQWQHEWAELFEKLADLVGRGIRYGEPPTHSLTDEERAALSSDDRYRHDLVHSAGADMVRGALELADAIDALEIIEQRSPGDSSLSKLRSDVSDHLLSLQMDFELLATIDRRLPRRRPEVL